MNRPILAYPARNAAMMATTSGANPVPDAGSSIKVSADARVIAGMPIKKENSAASFGFIPRRSAVPIVAPEREIPGATAIPWAIPMRRALFGASSAFWSFFREARKRNNPVTMMRRLTIKGWANSPY